MYDSSRNNKGATNGMPCEYGVTTCGSHDFYVHETITRDGLVRLRLHFNEVLLLRQDWSFSIAERLPRSIVLFAVEEAEKGKDEFWQMLCSEMAGDLVGMRLAPGVLHRLYGIGLRYDDWSIRAAVASRQELPQDLFTKILADPEDEVRRHFLFAHKDVPFSDIKVAYVKMLQEDVRCGIGVGFVSFAKEEAIRYIADIDVSVRKAALEFLCTVGNGLDWRCAKAVAGCLFDDHPDVRSLARRFFAR